MARLDPGAGLETRRRSTGKLALATFWLAASCHATVDRWQIQIRVADDGTVHERRAIDVMLDDPETLEDWRYDVVFLDSNRTLENYVAVIRRGDQRIDADDFSDRASLVLRGESFSSREVALRSFHRARTGDRLEVVSSIKEQPFYPGAILIVPRDHGIEQLSIDVTNESPARELTWHLRPEPAATDLEITSSTGGLTIRGTLAESDEPLELWLSWAEDPSWTGVANWFHELTRDLPGLSTTPADFPLPTGTDPAARIATAVRLVQEKVRYVAVEVGVGGYRPSPPAETWARRWGDCKDKAALVIERLRQEGIAAYPALVRSSWTEPTDPTVPSPFAFNHMIVAVPPTGEPAASENDDGRTWSFFDPTQDFGGTDWLHPGVQGQHTLVVRPAAVGGGVLLQIPRQIDHERRDLRVDLFVDAPTDPGRAGGTAMLELQGFSAAQLLWSDDAPQTGRQLLEDALPSFEVGRVEIATSRDGVPNASIRARVSGPSPWNGRGSLRLPDASSFGILGSGLPEPRGLAGTATVHWSVRLPEQTSCTPDPASQLSWKNDAGRTSQEVRRVEAQSGEEEITIEVFRATSPARQTLEWRAEDLAELAASERRLRRSRVRLDCRS